MAEMTFYWNIVACHSLQEIGKWSFYLYIMFLFRVESTFYWHIVAHKNLNFLFKEKRKLIMSNLISYFHIADTWIHQLEFY